MKIIYGENPLSTTVEPNMVEKEIMYLKYCKQVLEEQMWFIIDTYEKEKNKDFDERHQKYINWKKRAFQHIDEGFAELLEGLLSTHCGDCVKVPCSCVKCESEGYLNIDTIKDFDYNMLYKYYGKTDFTNEVHPDYLKYKPKVGTIEHLYYFPKKNIEND